MHVCTLNAWCPSIYAQCVHVHSNLCICPSYTQYKPLYFKTYSSTSHTTKHAWQKRYLYTVWIIHHHQHESLFCTICIPSTKWPMLIDITHSNILFVAIGVGRIIAEAKSTPTVIPFWHVGKWVLCCRLLCICALFHRNGWYTSKLCTLHPTSFQGTCICTFFWFDDNPLSATKEWVQ